MSILGWFSKKRRREEIGARPFSEEFLAIVDKNVRWYRRLNVESKAELIKKIQVFLAEKAFEGCGGLELNDEIRVTIAAQACLLLLGTRSDYYPKLQTILVYPSAYLARTVEPLRGGGVIEKDEERIGESWVSGVVVLAWDEIEEEFTDPFARHNVVLHEFAHQLDYEDGAADGAPLLSGRGAYARWAKVMRKEFESLRRRRDLGRPGVIDDYGAKNPAEFFAVATETFFERPRSLRLKHQSLYEELKRYYRLDPVALLDDASPSADESAPNDPIST